MIFDNVKNTINSLMDKHIGGKIVVELYADINESVCLTCTKLNSSSGYLITPTSEQIDNFFENYKVLSIRTKPDDKYHYIMEIKQK